MLTVLSVARPGHESTHEVSTPCRRADNALSGLYPLLPATRVSRYGALFLCCPPAAVVDDQPNSHHHLTHLPSLSSAAGLLGGVKKEPVKAKAPLEMDDLEMYLADTDVPDIDDDILKWWRVKELKWPRLAKMVKQYFSAPASSSHE